MHVALGYSKAYIKQRTSEIYSKLPQNREQRMKCLKERDEIIDLNYAFFGYVASKKFVNNRYISYEDKFQATVLAFCTCWWWYQWDGDESHKGYRKDLAFTVFYKPRLSEMLEREFDEVKYSLRRSLCMEVGNQLGKPWTQVKYADIAQCNLSPEKLIAIKAIFGTMYATDLETHEMFIPGTNYIDSPFEHLSDKYNSIEDLLIHDMVTYEEKLTDDKLAKMSEIYGISFDALKSALPAAEEKLHQQLLERLDMQIE